MAKRPSKDPKPQALQAHDTLHARAHEVTDELFCDSAFFDPRDRLQVKYEMLRRVRVDGMAIAQAARRFGLSRPAFYKANNAFEREGLPGLLPQKRGPRRAHKLSSKVMAFIATQHRKDPSLKARDVVRLLRDAFDLRVHPRTIERALKRMQKKTT